MYSTAHRLCVKGGGGRGRRPGRAAERGQTRGAVLRMDECVTHTCVCVCVRRTSTAKDGYTLPAYSWFLDQTIAGAVATATHGSSLVHGSLSSQVGQSAQPSDWQWQQHTKRR